MSKSFSFGSLQMGVNASAIDGTRAIDPDAPFRILVLGDFSGRGSRGITDPSDLPERRPILVDRDDIDDVIAQLGVELSLPIGQEHAAQIRIGFQTLEDFHPDRLYERLELFQAFRDLRRRLDNPATFDEAAAEVRSWLGITASQSTPAPTSAPEGEPPVSPPPNVSDADLLNQMLDQSPATAEPDGTGIDWNAFIREFVEPHVLPGRDPRQSELAAAVDAATGGQMSAVLHHPDFQALEAAWRSIDFLTRRLETGTDLKLFLLDVSKDELAADLVEGDQLDHSGLAKRLVDAAVGTPGAEPWSLFVGNYTFGPTRGDVELLGRLSRIAAAAGTPWISAGAAGLLGCESFATTPDPDDWQPLDREIAEGWQALGELPDASYLGLALPRFLLRLPYGQSTDPTEQLPFEEMEEPRHDAYLWGNAAIACALALGQAFTREGGQFAPPAAVDIPKLPLHVFKRRGESTLQPCAEANLSERAIGRIYQTRLMPLFSIKGQNAARLGGFRSLSAVDPELRGRWRP